MIQFSIKSGFYLTMCAALAMEWHQHEYFTWGIVYCFLMGVTASLFFFNEKQTKRHALAGAVAFLFAYVVLHWLTLWFDYVVLKKPANIAFEDGLFNEVLVAPVLVFVIFLPWVAAFALAGEVACSALIHILQKLRNRKESPSHQ